MLSVHRGLQQEFRLYPWRIRSLRLPEAAGAGRDHPQQRPWSSHLQSFAQCQQSDSGIPSQAWD